MAQVIEHNDVHDYIDDTTQYDHVVATVDKEKMSQWMTQHTGSKQFKNLANLEYHMIRPYFYKVGIPDKDIDVKYIKQSDAIKGETKVKIKDRTLYVDFY